MGSIILLKQNPHEKWENLKFNQIIVFIFVFGFLWKSKETPNPQMGALRPSY